MDNICPTTYSTLFFRFGTEVRQQSTLCESFVTNDVGWLFAKVLSGVG